jgi:hypothetical protein
MQARNQDLTKKTAYTWESRYKYPNKWLQAFAKWTINYRSFLETFCNLYKNDKFALWIVGHKENVDKIMAKEGFLTGF